MVNVVSVILKVESFRRQGKVTVSKRVTLAARPVKGDVVEPCKHLWLTVEDVRLTVNPPEIIAFCALPPPSELRDLHGELEQDGWNE